MSRTMPPKVELPKALRRMQISLQRLRPLPARPAVLQLRHNRRQLPLQPRRLSREKQELQVKNKKYGWISSVSHKPGDSRMRHLPCLSLPLLHTHFLTSRYVFSCRRFSWCELNVVSFLWKLSFGLKVFSRLSTDDVSIWSMSWSSPFCGKSSIFLVLREPFLQTCVLPRGR